jgi:hypothetical protein
MSALTSHVHEHMVINKQLSTVYNLTDDVGWLRRRSVHGQGDCDVHSPNQPLTAE